MKISTSQIVHFINPTEVINNLELNEGMTIADFGCGAGYFSLPVARAIGKDGIVYALDVLPQALESVQSKAKLEGITNIVTKRANLEKAKGSGLAEESVDCVIIKDVLFQNQDKEAILKEAWRILKSDGQALVVEWDNKDFSLGPEKTLRVSREKLIELIKKMNFKIKKIMSAGNFHYAFIVVK